MRYSRPVRVILGILILAVLFLYESMWYRGSRDTQYAPLTAGAQAQAAQAAPQEGGDASASDAASAQPEGEAGAEAAAQTEAAATPAPALRPEEERAAALGLPSPPEIDVTQLQYVLVNGDHPLDPITYEPENLVYLNMTGDDTEIRTAYDGGRQVVDNLIAQPLIDMTQACKAEGMSVYLSSGYRSYSTQEQNFQRVNINNGITDGKDANGNYITMPAGHSEHQTGLCCDITDRYYEVKNDDIVNSATVQWLAAHCADYGFVLRFPQEKSSITHVMSENWHFRYVGVEAAKYMTENNLCLEEFLALYGVE